MPLFLPQFVLLSVWACFDPFHFTPPVIDAPRHMDVRDVTDNTALVTWFHPVADVDGISISYGPSSDPANRRAVELPPTDTQFHLGGLTADTQYDVSLKAKKGDQTSSPAHSSFLTGNAPTF